MWSQFVDKGGRLYMAFSNEEFDIMVDELLFQEIPSFDMLCSIVNKVFSSKVRYWCATEDCLKNRRLEEDLMQRIQMKFILVTITGFLKREDLNGEINRDPDGFFSWMKTVANNTKRDFCNEIRNYDFNTSELDDSIKDECTDSEITQKERIERLKEAVDIVFSSNINVYKTLTWMAQMIFIIGYGVSKKKSNIMILEAFENKTLFDMYKMIKLSSKYIPWLVIDGEKDVRIYKQLNKSWNENLVYGEVTYSTFFMKKGGVNTISDWVNRVNNMIRRAME